MEFPAWLSIILLVIVFGSITIFLKFRLGFKLQSKEGKKILVSIFSTELLLLLCIFALQVFRADILLYFICLIPAIIMIIITLFITSTTTHRNDILMTQIQNSVEDIDSSSEEMNASISEISATTEEISAKATRIKNMSTDIERVIRIMKKAAEQSKILSLNASIEAGRAGEHGLGFSVVATKFIEMSDEINEGVEKSLNPVSEIVYMIQELAQNLEEISAATEQSSMTSETIVTAMKTLIKKTKEVK